jgi:hypothetical protein
MLLLAHFVPPFVALLLLGAHFYRAGWTWLAAAAVALTLLLAVPRPWAARTVQAALVLGAVEWLRTLATLVALRLAMGQPWLRLAVIVGAVAALTLVAAWLIQRRAPKAYFRLA